MESTENFIERVLKIKLVEELDSEINILEKELKKSKSQWKCFNTLIKLFWIAYLTTIVTIII